MLFELAGKAIHAQPSAATGLIDLNAIREGKPFITGWFNPVDDFPGPFAFAAVVDGTVLRVGGAKERPQPADAPAELAHFRRFECIGKIPWPPALPQPKKVEVFLVSSANTAIRLGFAPRQEGFVFNYTDRAQYFQCIQAPSRRLLDKEALAFHARQFFDAVPDPVLRASALIVMAYRLLENNQAASEAGEQVLRDAAPLLQHLAGFTRLPEYKWYISLADICHYIKVASGDPYSDEAIEYLWEIYRRRENLAIPGGPAQQLPNHLRSIFLLGNALWHRGQRAEAEEVLLSAKDAMRMSAPHWMFDNYYSAAELIMAAQQVRACLLRLAELKHRDEGAWFHPSYAAGKPATDYNCLSYPTAGWLRSGVL